MAELMTRDEFRNTVFERDNHTCVVPDCSNEAKDAHHIMERALWTEDHELGGYYVENGASLCHKHHRWAEDNMILPQKCREWAGIQELVLPSGLDPNIDYDKWGEPLKMPSEIRKYVKYPSTFYLSVSPSCDSNYMDINKIKGPDMVITIKMDGSNALITRDHVAARNGDQAVHPSFDYLKSIHAQMGHNIPDNLQIFGEWLYAKHSIHYADDLALDGYFQVFGVYDTETRFWLSWEDTKEWAKLLDFPIVPVVGQYGTMRLEHELLDALSRLGAKAVEECHEGIVVRPTTAFHYGQFSDFVGKYVRMNHIQTGDHWRNRPLVKNEVQE